MTQTKAELLQTRHQGDIRLGDADSTHYVGFKAPSTVSSSLVWTLPAADGTANYLLKTDGSGNLGWVADSSTDSTKMPLAGGTFTGDVTFSGASVNCVWDKSDNALEFAAQAIAAFGASSALQVYNNGTDNYIDSTVGHLYLRGPTDASKTIVLQAHSGENSILANPDGGVELYYDSVKHFETHSLGIKVIGAEAGIAQIDIQPDEADDNADKWKVGATDNGYFFISNKDSGAWDTNIVCNRSGNVELYHDNVKTFLTESNGITVQGPEGGNALINLYADEGDDNADKRRLLVDTNGDFYISNYADGAWETDIMVYQSEVRLYYDNSIKLQTTSTGIDVTGTAVIDGITIDGAYEQVSEAVSALDIDLSTGNYFTKTINANSTFTFSNPAASGTVSAFTLELTHSSGTVTWPSEVKWNGDSAPTLTAGKTHLFMFVTDDGGSRYRGAALVDYVN